MHTEARSGPATGSSGNGAATGGPQHRRQPDLGAALDALGTILLLLDREGAVVHLNMVAERAFDRPSHALVGQSLLTLAPALIDGEGDAGALGLALAAALQGNRQEVEWAGRNHGYDLTLAPLPDGGVAVCATDARRRLNAESRAREAESLERSLREAQAQAERASRSKTRFLAAASHDLRQPAQALTLFGAVLADRLRDHPAAALVGRLNESTDALRMLLDGLLDVSRLDAGIVEPNPASFALADLFAKLQGEFAPHAEAKGLRLRIVPSTVRLCSDAALLERMLGNLLDNALKYTGCGGIVVGCRRRGDSVRIDVIDSGIGLQPDQIDEIFEEFVQLGNQERDRRCGLGLGLAVVRRLGRLLDLPVSVASTPGRGARFSVEVPLDRPDATDASTIGREEPTAGLAVLIDDDPMVLQSLHLVLELWGWEVVAATSQAEAVGLLARSGRTPDAIVADYRLRDGRTGVEAIRAVQTAARRIVPAVVLTGDTSPERIQEARQSGFVVLHKPINPTDLAAGLAQACGLPQPVTAHPPSGGAGRTDRAAHHPAD